MRLIEKEGRFALLDVPRGVEPAAVWDFNRKPPYWTTTSPYAAAEYFGSAEGSARDALAPIQKEYDASHKTESDFYVPVPPGQELKPFQKASIEYIMARSHGLIGDPPGLGKTMQGIGISNLMKARKTLVICPASIRLQWRQKVIEWSTIPRVFPYPIIRATDGCAPSAQYVIVSYDLVSRSKAIFDVLMSYDWDHHILDEGHYLKTPTTRRTVAIFGNNRHVGLASKARRVTVMTGTYLPNRPKEGYTIARFIDWSSIDWASKDAFEYKYNPSTRWEERTGNLGELRVRLRSHFMTRHIKRDVQKQLPHKEYELAYVEPSGEISRALKAEKSLVGDAGTAEDIMDALAANEFSTDGEHISSVRMQMGLAKAPRVAEYVKDVLGGGVDKLVLFAYHRDVISLLENSLRAFKPVVIRGETPAAARHQAVQRFITDPECRLFLGNYRAAGTGIDGLQKVASRVIFAEASWTPGENEQAIDRVDRMGQEENVLAQFLVAQDSIDEKILGSAIRKEQTTKEALDG